MIEHPDFDDPNGHYDKFCAAIGHLFLGWARMENVFSIKLRMYLARKNGPDGSVRDGMEFASTMLGSLRFSKTKEHISKLFRFKEDPTNATLYVQAIFDHLGEVGKLRDEIAHQMFRPLSDAIDGNWSLSNYATTKSISGITKYQVNADMVLLAAEDLITASGFISMAFPDPHCVPIAPAEWKGEPLPWLYKPSLLKSIPKNTAHSPQ